MFFSSMKIAVLLNNHDASGVVTSDPHFTPGLPRIASNTMQSTPW